MLDSIRKPRLRPALNNVHFKTRASRFDFPYLSNITGSSTDDYDLDHCVWGGDEVCATNASDAWLFYIRCSRDPASLGRLHPFFVILREDKSPWLFLQTIARRTTWLMLKPSAKQPCDQRCDLSHPIQLNNKTCKIFTVPKQHSTEGKPRLLGNTHFWGELQQYLVNPLTR